jgi:L-alanine-DL-glutamate epimerase-like enolase superfamily enzyme
MIENRPDLVGGEFPLPETPGLGWALDRTFIDRYRTDRE